MKVNEIRSYSSFLQVCKYPTLHLQYSLIIQYITETNAHAALFPFMRRRIASNGTGVRRV